MTCHNCRIDAPKHGKHRNGLQRFRCWQCGKTFTEPHEEGFLVEMYLSDPSGILALRMLTEGTSVRTAERITGLHRNTILQLVNIAGERCGNLLATKVKGVPATDVQCDEIWGFVRKKKSHMHGGEKDFAFIGDAWCFVAIDRNTKLVLAHTLGKRTVTAATRFMMKLARATDPAQRFQLTTDGLNAYPLAVGNVLGHQGERVDYAQLIKIFAMDVPEDARRYSPPHLAEAIPTPIYGYPDDKRICTSHVERQNLTMRMCMRRLTRLTNAFSKKWENLKAALALHFAYYNFCRKHITLRNATPAMAAGLTDHVWTIGELLEWKT
jgi:transposase-like protein/IS1 family transposase